MSTSEGESTGSSVSCHLSSLDAKTEIACILNTPYFSAATPSADPIYRESQLTNSAVVVLLLPEVTHRTLDATDPKAIGPDLPVA